MVSKYKKGIGQGWRNESARHSLASRGIKTKINYAEMYPEYDSRKSFYGNADVRREGGRIILKSYNTDVAYIKDGKAYVNGTYSPTTSRHIKEFLKQNGFKAESSAQIMRDYGGKEEAEEPKSSQKISRDEKPSISSSSMGTEFNLGGGITIVARTTPSRDGFNHVAEYYKDGVLIDSAKVHYINRTWEKYNFETAIRKLLDKVGVSEEQKKNIMGATERLSIGKSDEMFKSVAMVAGLGEIFGKSPKEKNDWKLRMLKAGLSGKGFEEPEDWNTLSEEEKGKRLDKILKFMHEKKTDYARLNPENITRIYQTKTHTIAVDDKGKEHKFKRLPIQPEKISKEDLQKYDDWFGESGFDILEDMTRVQLWNLPPYKTQKQVDKVNRWWSKLSPQEKKQNYEQYGVY
jgi:hypothetical protein